MGQYIGVNGETFTDDELEAWAAYAESGQKYTGGHIGPSASGPPVSIGAQVRPFTVLLDAARRAKLHRVAAEQGTTALALIRRLIDSL
ncbi:DNA polymerase II [Nesterenkonia sp. AN1]|nr:DNA polymerase II [Nesterenkonia sp. AN1]